MSEELQKQIAEALTAMRDGAPGAWEKLCEEVIARGTLQAVTGFVLLFLAAVVALLAYRMVNKMMKSDDYRNADDLLPIIVTAVLLVAVLFLSGATNAYEGLAETIAPSLELLRIIQ